jgi:HPt (histidine-containing phosphotransfer) domain-containing protein
MAMSEALVDRGVLDELESQLGRAPLVRVVAAQLLYAKQVAAQLSAQVAAPDMPFLRRIAHQMAGSSASVGLVVLGQTALALESRLFSEGATVSSEDVVALRDLTIASLDALTALFPDAV